MERRIKLKYTRYIILYLSLFLILLLYSLTNNNVDVNKNKHSTVDDDVSKKVNISTLKKTSSNKNKDKINNNKNIITDNKLYVSLLDSNNFLKNYHETLKSVIKITSEDSNASNNPPVADAGISKNLSLGEDILLDGSNSYDKDLDQLTFNWTITEAPKDTDIELKNNTLPTFSVKINTPGTYVFNLIVSDGKAYSKPSIVEYTVEGNNNLPVAIISGPNQINSNTDFMLSAIESYDPNKEKIIDFKWSQVSGPEIISGNLLGAKPNININIKSSGQYVFGLSVFNGVNWSLKTFKQIIVKNENEILINISGKSYLNTTEKTEYILETDEDITEYDIKWYFSYKPEGSKSSIIKKEKNKAFFKPDFKGYYILNATVYKDNQKLASTNKTIQSDPNILNERVLSNNLNKKNKDLYISAGSVTKVCNNDSSSIKLNGKFGGLNSEKYTENWEIIKKPSNSEASINKDSQGNYILKTNNKIGEYKLKYSIINNTNNHTLEDEKTVYILTTTPGFKLPQRTGIPEEILKISDKNDYGHKIIYGPQKKLFTRQKKDNHTYIVFKDLIPNINHEIISTNLDLNEINQLNNDSLKSKDLSEKQKKKILKQKKEIQNKMKIYGLWSINKKDKLPYYLFLDSNNESRGNFYLKHTNSKYEKINYEYQSIPFYDDLPVNNETIAELISPGEKVYLEKVDFIQDKPYYFNSRVFHAKWNGVLNDEKQIMTFKIVRRKLNGSSCYEIHPL